MVSFLMVIYIYQDDRKQKDTWIACRTNANFEKKVIQIRIDIPKLYIFAAEKVNL
jgi:hypothetical protein